MITVFNMVTVWLVVMIVLLIIESAIPGLVSIWFALGALAAMISALFNAQLWLQVLWFFVISVVSLIVTRPLVKKYVNGRIQPTNADALIGKDCVVEEDIDNILGTGAVKIAGKIWTARSADDGEHYGKGVIVKVLRIEGVKLIVNSKGV